MNKNHKRIFFLTCVALCDVECVHVAGLAQAEGMWSVHLGDERWNVFTRLKGMSVFTQATRGGVCSRRWKGGAVCSRRWKGCGVFTQVEGMWSVHAGDERWNVFTQVEGMWSVGIFS